MIIKLIIMILLTISLFGQPNPTYYYSIKQKNDIYYLATNSGFLKLHTPDLTGQFNLLNYIEKNITSEPIYNINNKYLIFKENFTFHCYSVNNNDDLNYVNSYMVNFIISEIFDFGPYFIIRSNNTYKLVNVTNDSLIILEDSIFTYSNTALLNYYYPYIIRNNTVYKYLNGFGIYAVTQISHGNAMTALTANEILTFTHWVPPSPPAIFNLRVTKIEEPNFPSTVYNNWGANTPELHYLGSPMYASKNLIYIPLGKVVVNRSAQLIYLHTSSEKITISDYFIFKIGNTLQYLKWNAGSVFNPLIWNDLTSIRNDENNININFSLSQNFPNPFNPVTVISFQLPVDSYVELKVYDVLGREVAVLVNNYLEQGNHEIEFITEEYNLNSGVYFYQLRAEEFVETRKMILMR